MAERHSTYEAKARFSGVLRKVRGGESVVITYRGTAVAEIRPIDETQRSLEERIERLRVRHRLGERIAFLTCDGCQAELAAARDFAVPSLRAGGGQ